MCDCDSPLQVRFPPELRVSPELLDLFARILEKDPAKRITLEGIMSHPWTTEHGRSPLPCVKSLLIPPAQIEVSQNEQQSAIDRSSLVSMIRARLKEKQFLPGEYLFREGEEAHCVFMIMSGVVEIVAHLSGGVDTSVIDEMEEQSFSVDLDESFTLDCNQLVPAGLDVKDGKLHIDRQKVRSTAAGTFEKLHGGMQTAASMRGGCGCAGIALRGWEEADT